MVREPTNRASLNDPVERDESLPAADVRLKRTACIGKKCDRSQPKSGRNVLVAAGILSSHLTVFAKVPVRGNPYLKAGTDYTGRNLLCKDARYHQTRYCLAAAALTVREEASIERRPALVRDEMNVARARECRARRLKIDRCIETGNSLKDVDATGWPAGNAKLRNAKTACAQEKRAEER
jgi:hypothetical protein